MVAMGAVTQSALARIQWLTMSSTNSALLKQMTNNTPVWKTAVEKMSALKPVSLIFWKTLIVARACQAVSLAVLAKDTIASRF